MSTNKKPIKFTKRLWVLLIILLLSIGAKAFYTFQTHHIEEHTPSATEAAYDVDLVYLWCDGDDPKFKEQKNYWLQQEGKDFDIQAAAPGRFEQVDELKYSLRSVEEYLPWLHHIYIVTADQIPSWLNTEHPKLTVVDHTEIIPKKYLPVFSSNAIETSIHKIPGLAEHFLLANDDTFVGRPLTKEFFFQNGSPIIRLKPGSVANTGSLYREQILHAIELSEQDLHSPIPIFSERNVVPHHNIDAYLKSDYTACTAHFKKEYEKTLTHRFRKGNDVQRIIVDIWAFTHGDADIRIVRPFSKKPKQLDSLMLTNTETDYAKKLNSRNPGLFCINDGELSSQEDRMRTKQFLEKRFPKKSEFEK